MRSYRAPLVAAFLAAAALAAAGTYTIRLTPFPTAEVADGRSQVNVRAQVFQDNHAAPDGTQVVFETNLGSFRESVVRTVGGWANATLITGGVPGVARIKATVSVGDATGSTCEVEFVKTREELSQARETIEATSSGSLIYANDKQVIEGVAEKGGVEVRYRDLEIHADVLQLDLRSYTLRARKATLRHGRRTTYYDSLNIDLSSRTGYGLTNYPVTRPDSIVAFAGGVAFTETAPDGTADVAKASMRFGLVEVGREKDSPLNVELGEDPFAMADLSASPSTVGSRKAVVYARREIQFHRADIFVDNAKVLKFPLFVVNLNNASGSPLVTDEFLGINDNQIALNYPHYLSLKPGLTSLVRFRTGQRYGQSLGGNGGGAFLDYELAWSKGDDMQGGFTLGGMGRTDWVASLKQYARLGGNTVANFQIDSPGGKGAIGSGSVSKGLGNFTLALNGTQNQNWVGPKRSDLNYGLSFERNPERVQGTPVRISYGLAASASRSVGPHLDQDGKIDGSETIEQSGAGLTTRLYTDSIPLDKASSVNASFGAAKLYGPQAYEGVALNGAVSLTRNFSPSTSAFLTYNFLQDGRSERFTGKHSVSLVGNFNQGNTGLRLAGNKGIGVERMSLSGEASYRFSSLWRLGYTHFLTQYASESLTEYYYLISYRIGWREVGLTWSNRSKRIGVQLMNVNF